MTEEQFQKNFARLDVQFRIHHELYKLEQLRDAATERKENKLAAEIGEQIRAIELTKRMRGL